MKTLFWLLIGCVCSGHRWHIDKKTYRDTNSQGLIPRHHVTCVRCGTTDILEFGYGCRGPAVNDEYV